MESVLIKLVVDRIAGTETGTYKDSVDGLVGDGVGWVV